MVSGGRDVTGCVGAGLIAARTANNSRLTICRVSGALRIAARRCGRSDVGSPLQASVPYSLNMREALLVLLSTLTWSSLNNVLNAVRQSLTSFVLTSSFGRSIAYNRCDPLPLSAKTGSGQPWAASQTRQAQARS